MKKENLDKFDNMTSDELIGSMKRLLGWKPEEYKGIEFAVLFQLLLEKLVFEQALKVSGDKKIVLPKKVLEEREVELDELTFGQKITEVEKQIKKEDKKLGTKEYEKKRKSFSFAHKYNDDIRNNLYHSKIDKMNYKNKPLSLQETQRAIVKDFFESTGLFPKVKN